MKKNIIDFIIKLMKSKDLLTKFLYDVIVAVVSRLLKYIHFILFKITLDVEQLKRFFIGQII